MNTKELVSMDFGTRISNVVGDADLATRTIVAAKESALIVGIVVTGSVTDTLTFSDSSGNTLVTMIVLANTTEIMNIPFLADKGFVIDSTLSTSFITVIYRPGA